ncbi:MAG TPA: DNA ligase [Pseudomonadales bacterium]
MGPTVRLFCLRLLWLVAASDVAAGALPAPMLATEYMPGVDVSAYLVSEKLDGVRGRWDGTVLRFRSGEPIHAPAWFTSGWPAEPLDGELWTGRGRFDEVSGIVRALTPDDAEWRRVRFMTFDLPAHPGPFAERAAALAALVRTADIDWLQTIPQFRVCSAAELERRLDAVIARGGEGLILHHREARYRPGPSRLLLKYKRPREAGAVVVGHTEGRGKYRGLVGALIVERPDGRRFRLGSGLTDAERAAPPPPGSRVIYRFDGLTANGLPRFPRLVRIVPMSKPARGRRPTGDPFNEE